MEAFKVMIVEDDPAVRELTADALARWEFRALAPDPGEDLVAFFGHENPHLVVLDVGLPRFDGFEWCSRIRAISRVPILFMSARNASADMVRGLAEGGDDWLAKPFDVELLVAKVKALLRRAYSWAPERSPLIERAGLVLDYERGTASRGSGTVELSRNETALLRKLLERDGRVVSRDELMDALWSEDAFVDDNTLTVNVTRLKKTLGTLGADAMIETVRGSGYRIP